MSAEEDTASRKDKAGSHTRTATIEAYRERTVLAKIYSTHESEDTKHTIRQICHRLLWHNTPLRRRTNT